MALWVQCLRCLQEGFLQSIAGFAVMIPPIVLHIAYTGQFCVICTLATPPPQGALVE